MNKKFEYKCQGLYLSEDLFNELLNTALNFGQYAALRTDFLLDMTVQAFDYTAANFRGERAVFSPVTVGEGYIIATDNLVGPGFELVVADNDAEDEDDCFKWSCETADVMTLEQTGDQWRLYLASNEATVEDKPLINSWELVILFKTKGTNS